MTKAISANLRQLSIHSHPRNLTSTFYYISTWIFLISFYILFCMRELKTELFVCSVMSLGIKNVNEMGFCLLRRRFRCWMFAKRGDMMSNHRRKITHAHRFDSLINAMLSGRGFVRRIQQQTIDIQQRLSYHKHSMRFPAVSRVNNIKTRTRCY